MVEGEEGVGGAAGYLDRAAGRRGRDGECGRWARKGGMAEVREMKGGAAAGYYDCAAGRTRGKMGLGFRVLK